MSCSLKKKKNFLFLTHLILLMYGFHQPTCQCWADGQLKPDSRPRPKTIRLKKLLQITLI